jgi:demethylmenaquinone methyltransferase/2-methoxy-6-polyprenyl-1,4-benzoquinol methylase
MAPYNKNDPKSIQEMFGTIAKQYDRTNAVLSFQLHRRWNRALVSSVIREGETQEVLLDLCSGTGEIAFLAMKLCRGLSKIYLVDFCEEMLDCARQKAEKIQVDKQRLDYIKADVQEIPLLSSSVDTATIAYGIRNVKEPEKCFGQVFRTLKPGGRFGILELTEPANPLLRWGHSFYLKAILPILGKCLASNEKAYQYLCNSIHSFVKPAELQQLLTEAGFKEIAIIPLNGGIATIITAQKPDEQKKQDNR